MRVRIPATFIYDSRGDKRAYFLGKQSYERLKKAIQDAPREP